MFRRLLVVILCIVLVGSLFGANIVWAADRGPLDPDHVTASAEEAGLYAEVQNEVLAQLAEGDELSLPYPGLEDRGEDIIAQIVTDDWIQEESDRNIRNLYAHLQDDEPLELYIDFVGQQEHIESTLRNEFTLADMEIEQLDRLMANEASYLDERADLRSTMLDEIGVDPDDGFGVETIQDLLESPQSYDDTRTAIRGDIAEAVLDSVDADAGFGNDRLARMYDDPETYEAEQRDFHEQEKERIQAETDEELSDEELDQYYEDQQDEIVDAAAANASERIEFEDGPEAAEERAEELAVLKAEALATDLPYNEFTDRYDSIVNDFENDVIADIEENPGAYEDEVDEQVQDEMAAADVPDAVEDEVQGVADVTVEAITTDMTYDEYLDAYDAAVADVEAAAMEHISENRDEYDDELEAAALGDSDLDDVPATVEPETDAIVDLVAEAVITGMDYDVFMAELEDREIDLATALGEALFAEGMLPERLDFTEELTEAAGDELEHVSDLMGLVLPIALALSALSLILVGGIFAVVRDVALTSIASGASALVVGIPSIAAAALIPDIIYNILLDIDIPDGLRESIAEMIEFVIFSPFLTHGVVLSGLGIGLIGIGIALRLELIELPSDD